MTHLEVWLGEAPCNSDHGGSQRARDTDGGQKLRNVGCEAERDRAVGIQVPGCIIYIKPKVGDVQLAGVLQSTGGDPLGTQQQNGEAKGEVWLFRPRYLSDLQHLRVQPVQVQDKLCKADQGKLDGEHLPEGPVVRGVGERVQGPLLEHAARHHVALHLLENVSKDLKHTVTPPSNWLIFLQIATVYLLGTCKGDFAANVIQLNQTQGCTKLFDFPLGLNVLCSTSAN